MGFITFLRVGLALSSLVLLLGGCIEAKVQVSVEPDGTGHRSVEIAWDLESLEELKLSIDGFQELLDLDEVEGWSMRRETRWESGNERNFVVFRRTMEIGSLEAWTEQGGDIDIKARVAGSGDMDGTAHAGNDVSVELGRSGRGQSLTYRETYRIEGMKDLMDQFQSEQFAARVAQAFPDLTESDRAELRGLYFGHLTLQSSLYGQDDENPEQIEQLTRSLARATSQVVERRTPNVDTTAIDRIARDVLVDADEALDQHLIESLPGVLIAALFGVKLEVTVPGEVVDTNADQSSESYAAWEFQLWSAIDEPLHLFVRTEMPEDR